MTTRDTIAGEVRAEMGRQKISGRQLAATTGINQVTLARKLNGTVDFTAVELLTVAKALGMSLYAFESTG